MNKHDKIIDSTLPLYEVEELSMEEALRVMNADGILARAGVVPLSGCPGRGGEQWSVADHDRNCWATNR